MDAIATKAPLTELTQVPTNIFVGTAGWSIPKGHAAGFPRLGTHLERYAQRLTGVEINSSFYRPHKLETYARWAASVPEDFRFSVKMPREITHKRKLVGTAADLDIFLGAINELGNKLGPILVQLPPSLHYNESAVLNFFEALRRRFTGDIACEPRHPTWFTTEVDTRLKAFQIARVVADPPIVPQATSPGGYLKLLYLRLHGSPKIYYSPYASQKIDEAAAVMRKASERRSTCWCIFDNTALGEATNDALGLLARLAVLSHNMASKRAQ